MRRSRLNGAGAVRCDPFLGLHGPRRSTAEGSACFHGAFCHQGHPAFPALTDGRVEIQLWISNSAPKTKRSALSCGAPTKRTFPGTGTTTARWLDVYPRV